MVNAVRVGVVGCGAIGREHLKIWMKTDGAKVAAVCDNNSSLAGAMADSFSAVPFCHLSDMLHSGTIDALDICTPSGLHGDQGLAAALCGIHVITEKPLDLCIEKVDRLIEECGRRNLKLACIFQRRAFPGARRVAEIISHEGLGRILSISAGLKWWRSQKYYDSASWRGTYAMDGGVLANQAIHTLDHMCWIGGAVKTVDYVKLQTLTHDMEAEDTVTVVMSFENGAQGVLEATTCCSPDLCSRLEVYGTRGSVVFDDAVVVKFGIDGKDMLSTIGHEPDRIGGRSDPMAITMLGHELLLADFVQAISENREPIVNGEKARLSVDALNKIYRQGNPGLKIGL